MPLDIIKSNVFWFDSVSFIHPTCNIFVALLFGGGAGVWKTAHVKELGHWVVFCRVKQGFLSIIVA